MKIMKQAGEVPVVVYEPNQRIKMGYFGGWLAMARNLTGSRELIWQLFKRDFFSNYKQSYMGVLWIFISPVIGVISWVFLNATGVLMPGEAGVPYPVYVLLGSTIWGLFLGFYSSTAKSLRESDLLILQINFPHEVLVIKQIAQTVAAFAINLLLILLTLLVFDVLPSWKIVFFPLTVLPFLFIGAGIGMIVAVISSVAHDVEKAVTAFIGFLMYLTPVIYVPREQGEFIQAVIFWNPLAYLVGGARDVILYGTIGSPGGYAVSCFLSVLLFLLCWRWFFLSEFKVAEKL
jgi:lipopolysaccharide transport system permease protein